MGEGSRTSPYQWKGVPTWTHTVWLNFSLYVLTELQREHTIM